MLDSTGEGQGLDGSTGRDCSVKVRNRTQLGGVALSVCMCVVCVCVCGVCVVCGMDCLWLRVFQFPWYYKQLS